MIDTSTLSDLELSFWDAFRMMTGFPVARREELFRHFMRARQSALEGLEEPAALRTAEAERGAASSTQQTTGTAPNASKSLPARRTVLQPDSPLVVKTTTQEVEGMLIPLALAMGKEGHAERNAAVAHLIVQAGWTRAEFAAACRLIPTDPDLCKEADWKTGLAAPVFTQARQRDEVRRGRLFEHHDALAIAELRQRALSEVFDPVYLEGDDKPWFRMRADAPKPGSSAKSNSRPRRAVR